MKLYGRVWAIIDEKSKLFFSRSHNPKTGWYTSQIANARFYNSPEAAQLVIDSNSFKVSHPGDRSLVVKAFSLNPSIK